MNKIFYIINQLFNFIVVFFIFNLIFIFAEIVFYKIIGITPSIAYIFISNIKSLFLIFLIIYIFINIIFYLYDIYYIKKINKILIEIKGGEFNNEKK